ncbi:MAG: hypothetical protein KKB30_06200 [Proteobacteria bacterium]|nr:hypothetical protein [Pseudomonadota bacterium]MBU1715112.1 hypothetical protein [Pseudomonadota bacterium]
MNRLFCLLFAALGLFLPLTAGAGGNQWTGSGPFATGLGNRLITALTVSADGKMVYAGTGSATVFTFEIVAPTLGGSFLTNGAVDDNATIIPFAGVTVDVVGGDPVSVTISYPGANGTLSGAGLSGVAGNYLLAAAVPATVTGNLQALVFTPTVNQVSPGLTVATSFTLTPFLGTESGSADSSTLVTATSINDPSFNTVPPAISGTLLVGNVLTGSNGTWDDADGDVPTYSYQWYQADDAGGANEAAIIGANANTYTPTTGVAHKYLRLVVTADDGYGSNDQTATSTRLQLGNTAPTLGGSFTTAGTVADNATIFSFSGLTVGDVDGDNVSITITYPAANGVLSGTGLGGAAGNYTLIAAAPATVQSNLRGLLFSPTVNQVAPGVTVLTSFTLTPDDGTALGSADGSTLVTTTGVNDAPSFTKGADQTVNEDSGSQSVPAWATGLSPGPVNEAGQGLSFILSNNNNLLFSVQPALAPSGGLTYTPAANAFGSATVTVVIHDDGGTANGGVDTSANQTFTITITGLNDPPEFIGTPIIIGRPVPGSPLSLAGNDTIDPDGNPVILSYQWQANGGDIGGATGAVYSPGISDVGKTITCAVTADDGQGQSNSTATVFSTGIVVLPDSDGDGITDQDDLCPDDPDNDLDGDGVCGDVDAFPDDPALFELGINSVDFIRVDGGDIAANLVDGKPKVDIYYRFRATINYPAAGKVWLILNGYPQQMDCGSEPVDFSGVVDCSFDTLLGPAASHRYQVEIRDSADYEPSVDPLVRSNGVPGPVIELLTGANMVGLAKALAGIDLADLLGSDRIYRWISGGLSSAGNIGAFEYYDNNRFNTPGQGYFIERQNLASLPDLSAYPEHSEMEFTVDLLPGWNMITNPYGGQVLLADVKLQRNDEDSLPWTEACAANLLVNAIYSYQGEDWGSVYGFASAGGDPEARLVPWLGYWVYVVRDDGDYKLVIPNPLWRQ